MIRDDFIRQQDIVYLDHKHKNNNLTFTQKSSHFPLHMAFNHPNDVFYFQDASEDNGIHVLFII
jgi:hypothetical protein